jgi:quercetin dioxygenase-like cupin family protein
MATIRNLSDAKQVTTEIDLFGPRIEFLTPPDGASLSVMKGVVPAGAVVPLHSHADVEAFYLTAGQLQMFFQTENNWIAVRPGQFVFIPGNEKHAWRNVSAKDAILLIVTTAKLGNFLEEIGITISGEGQPLAPSPERLQHFVETAIRYGYWLGNPEENAAIGISL